MDQEKLKTLWKAYRAAVDAWTRQPVSAPWSEQKPVFDGRDTALAALEECGKIAIPARELALIQAGRDSTCCCADHSAVINWCSVEFGE